MVNIDPIFIVEYVWSLTSAESGQEAKDIVKKVEKYTRG